MLFQFLKLKICNRTPSLNLRPFSRNEMNLKIRDAVKSKEIMSSAERKTHVIHSRV